MNIDSKGKRGHKGFSGIPDIFEEKEVRKEGRAWRTPLTLRHLFAGWFAASAAVRFQRESF